MIEYPHFGPIELAVAELLEARFPGAKVSGDIEYIGNRAPNAFFVAQVPGAGKLTETEGTWYVDVDVFDTEYLDGLDRAEDVSILFLNKRLRTSKIIFDKVEQSSPPAEIPWRDDSVYRIGATYSFTARRISRN